MSRRRCLLYQPVLLSCRPVVATSGTLTQGNLKISNAGRGFAQLCHSYIILHGSSRMILNYAPCNRIVFTPSVPGLSTSKSNRSGMRSPSRS